MKSKLLFLVLILSVLSFSYLYAQDADFNRTGTSDYKVPAFNETESALTTATWTTLTASPHAVSRSCCVYFKRNDTAYIYQFGGGAGALLTTVARYNLRTSTWTNNVSTIPFSISAGSAVADGDSVIYVFGGNNPVLGKTLKYNVASNTWTTLTDMPTPATDMLVVKYQDTLVYAICGGDGLFGTGVNNGVRLFRMRSASWTALTAFPLTKSMVGGGIYKDTIIVTGGWPGAAPGNSATHKGVITPSNPTNIVWTAIANYPNGGVTRMASYVCLIPGQGVGIACTGGAVDGGTTFGATNFWNFCTQAWQTLPANPFPRSNFKAAGTGDSLMWPVAGFNAVGVGNFEKLAFSQIDGNCAAGGGPTTGVVTVCRTGIRRSIPENGGNGNPAIDTINISGVPAGMFINRMTVKVDSVIHTWVGDLRFWLTKVGAANNDTLISRLGWTGTGFGNACDNVIGCNLVDTAAQTVQYVTATTTCGPGNNTPIVGYYRPKSPLGAFNNINPNGAYVLRISDNAGGDTGNLRNWCITIEYSNVTGVSNNNTGIVNGYKLNQNYPNPFNPATTISYAIPKAGNVALRIYNILGKEVMTLVNEYKSPGNHEVQFNAANLSSGVYFYRLEVNGYIDMKKMMLLK